MVDQVSMDEAFLRKVQEAIEKYYADASFGVEELAREVGISRAQLYRKLQSLTGKAANQMIREFRLQRAYELLQMRFLTISEIAYQVGFSSPSYFNTCFRQYFGYPPGKIKPGAPVKIKRKFFHSRIASYISLATALVAVLLLLVFILSPGKDPFMPKARDKQTYIAVIPFTYLSEDKDYQHLADAMTDEIIYQLSYNQDLRVMPGISVEYYLSKERNIRQITRKMDVSYILDGSFQKQGDQVNVYVYLVNARINRVEWNHKVSGNYTDIFRIQSQIAQRIARELDIEITPDVRRIMEKIPSKSLDAADFYWRGNDELNKFNAQDSGALERAAHQFHEAIRLDPAFARAYVGLAEIYWIKHFWDTFLREDFADSALILADKALSYDPQLAEAYIIRGKYYETLNNKEQAIKEFDTAIRLNPSSVEAYVAKARLYIHVDLVNRIENLHKAALLKRGDDLPSILRILGGAYNNAGFRDIAYDYMNSAFELDNDSAAHYGFLAGIEHCSGEFKRSIELFKESYVIGSSNVLIEYLIGLNYAFLDNYEEYLVWLRRYEEKQLKHGYAPSWSAFWGTFRLAHAYGINGFEDEADYHIAQGLALYDKMLELDRHYMAPIVSFYYMAAIYAYKGNSEKAYEYLNKVNNRQGMPAWMIPCINFDPMFDSLREDPQFQQIVRDVDAKFQAEHERVRQWMEENDVL